MKTESPPSRRIVGACARLQETVEELDAILVELPMTAPGADAIHEAIGTIMESLRHLNSAYRRLDPRDAPHPVDGEE